MAKQSAKSPAPPESFVPRRVVAKFWGVCPTTVSNWARNGQLPAPTRGPNGQPFWPRSIIETPRTDDDVLASIDFSKAGSDAQ